jgi:regulation of enolase protein 1 (concanavalin A-like superfamily)
VASADRPVLESNVGFRRAAEVRVALLFLAIPTALAAAPPPKEPETAKLKRLWGETIDLDKDCTFALDGDKLKIGVPNKSHLYRATSHDGGRGQPDNAPRTEQKVSGDFTLTVQLTQTRPATDKENAGSFAGAGVYILGGAGCCSVSLHHTAGSDGAVNNSQFRLTGKTTHSSTSGARGTSKDEATKPIALRLVREGNQIKTTYSTDGKTWKTIWNYDGEFAHDVTVGVYAENTGAKGYEAVFEGLKVETGEKK